MTGILIPPRLASSFNLDGYNFFLSPIAFFVVPIS